jgi:hypothetical protein
MIFVVPVPARCGEEAVVGTGGFIQSSSKGLILPRPMMGRKYPP